jgi:hypothetical protein
MLKMGNSKPTAFRNKLVVLPVIKNNELLHFVQKFQNGQDFGNIIA